MKIHPADAALLERIREKEQNKEEERFAQLVKELIEKARKKLVN